MAVAPRLNTGQQRPDLGWFSDELGEQADFLAELRLDRESDRV
jgi:hypothetical protein